MNPVKTDSAATAESAEQPLPRDEATGPLSEAPPAHAPVAVLSLPERLEAAVEGWHSRHFHSAVVRGSASITAEDKADLLQTVLAAASTPKE